MSNPLDVAREPVDAVLASYLDGAVAELAAIDPSLREVGEEAIAFVRGGKRLRPAFVHWGMVAAGGEVDERVQRCAAAVELLHAFALVHDDVMDRADQRRGRASLHRAMAARHRDEGLRGDADWFGIGAAILAGDLLFVWADELLDQGLAGRHGSARAREVFTRLRVEVMSGQFLDLRLAGLADPDVDEALRVALLKSGRYTVTRPLLLGAALAPEPSEVVEAALRAYGDALGVAFQLRDDVLGLFGDPDATGKDAVGDLREGKRTLLMLRALQMAEGAASALLQSALGDPELDEAGAQQVRDIVRDCGALAAVESELSQRLEAALAALDKVDEPASSALRRLAQDAVHRRF